MLNRKKMIALAAAACLTLSALPAVAEESAESAEPVSAAVVVVTGQRNGNDRMPGNGPQGGNNPMPGNGPQGGKNRMPGNGPQGGNDRMPGDGQQPPELPDGETPQMPGNGQQPPEMPDGMTPQMPGNGQQPPEMPAESQDSDSANEEDARKLDSEAPEAPQDGQQPPEMPDGEAPEAPQDGQQPPEMPDGTMPQMPGGMGGEAAPTEYAAANTLTGDSENASYASASSDENAVLVDGEEVTVSGAVITKTGDSDGESADFYGVNATVLATGGATLTLTDAEITSDGAHANGVFSYGAGTTVNISDSAITTTGNNSGGLMTTGGATLNAENLTVSTSGNSSAAIRSDRGGGTVNVTGGSYASAGVGSPAIYSTADITVSDATLSAGNSEAVVIEGGNSVTLNDVDITGSNATLNGQSTVNTNVLIYQSMSGDASEGASAFTMTGGSLTSLTGDMFHVTNVTTTITLSGVDLNASDGALLSATQDSWGRSGENGGHVTMNLSGQSASGDIVVDEVSSLSLSLTAGSDYTGAINADGAAGSVSVSLEDGSTWTLTGDSWVDSFDGDLSQVDLNGHTLYVSGEAVT